MVIAPRAAGRALGAGGADADTPVGDRVFKRLQPLEPGRPCGTEAPAPVICCWIAWQPGIEARGQAGQVAGRVGDVG